MDLLVDERPGGVAVVGWNGPVSIDASNAGELRERAGGVGAAHPRMVLDMGLVGFVDSSGVGALVGLMKSARERGGDLKLTGLSPDLRTILELTRLDRVFEIHPSADAAVRSFEEAG